MPRQPRFQDDDVQAILRSVTRVLQERHIHQPVQVRFPAKAGAATGSCWEWRCEPRADAIGAYGCAWVEITC